MSKAGRPEESHLPQEPSIPIRAFWHEDRPTRPVCAIVPALGTPARVYDRLAASLHESGIHVVVLELRGTGRSTARARRGKDWGYLDLVDGELRQTYLHIRQQTGDQSPIIWLGHSLGGHLALLHQRRHQVDQPADVLLAASGTPHYRHYSPGTRLGLSMLSAIIAASGAALGYFPGNRFGFGGRQPRTLMRQWLHFAWRGTLPASVMQVSEPNAKSNLRAALSMTGDAWAPKSATAHLASLFSCALDIDALAQLDDGTIPDHFSWLRTPKEPADWIARQISLLHGNGPD